MTIRILLAAVCLVLFAATTQAGSIDDLKAANEAVQKGKVTDAMRLYTRALESNDLSPADQLAARMGRGSEFVSASLIADAYERLDQAQNLRDSAIADFTAVLKAKTDDDSIYLARGHAYDMNGKHDAAIADFSAALKIKNAPVTLVYRATSAGAKGDYDRAIADYGAALNLVGKDAKDTGIDTLDIISQRAYMQFIAGRYAAAVADFDKALALGMPTRGDDVLWMPYQMAWLHIARARAGDNDVDELARNAGKINVKQWPGTLIAYFLGQTKIDEVTAGASHGSMRHARECGVAFFAGEHALAKKDNAAATQQLTSARAACNIHTVYYLAAGVELKRLGK
jgi:tetratricopeptide (TPR) repeat protein